MNLALELVGYRLPLIQRSTLALNESSATGSGVYALFIDDPAALHAITVPLQPNYGDGLIYIGMTCPAQGGAPRDHVDCCHSGGSTVRRSLGALLKDVLVPQLRAIPRRPSSDARDWQNYRFEDDGEAALTQWMRAHLCMNFLALSGDRRLLRSHEKRLIEQLRPPLNLTDWRNPEAGTIKALRSLCAREARGTPQTTA